MNLFANTRYVSPSLILSRIVLEVNISNLANANLSNVFVLSYFFFFDLATGEAPVYFLLQSNTLLLFLALITRCLPLYRALLCDQLLSASDVLSMQRVSSSGNGARSCVNQFLCL